MVIEFNAAAERTFGYTKAQAIGRTLADLIVPPPFRAAHTAGLARYLATGDGPLLGKVIEMTAVRSDGSELQWSWRSRPSTPRGPDIHRCIARHHGTQARRRDPRPPGRDCRFIGRRDLQHGLDDTILTWNAGAERLYGYTASEMIGRNRPLLAPAGKRGDGPPAVGNGLNDVAFNPALIAAW